MSLFQEKQICIPTSVSTLPSKFVRFALRFGAISLLAFGVVSCTGQTEVPNPLRDAETDKIEAQHRIRTDESRRGKTTESGAKSDPDTQTQNTSDTHNK